MSKEEELGYLKDQAQAVKEQLDRIESRMHDLEANG
jgi:archaellum component FlaC